MRTNYENRDLNATFGDSRLDKHFEIITGQLSQNLSDSITESTLKLASIKITYRFFHNRQVTPEKMLHYHQKYYRQSLDVQSSKAKDSKKPIRVLHLSDTTELDYTSKKSKANLGPLNFKNRIYCYIKVY